MVVVLLAFRSSLADWYDVPTGSMKPTILIGDRIFVNKVAYDLTVPFTSWRVATWCAPARGDIAFDDVTDLVSAQRMAAWGDVARRIAHAQVIGALALGLLAERRAREALPQAQRLLGDKDWMLRAAAYRYLHSYDPRWRFSTWLYRIAIRNAGKLHNPELVDVNEMRDLRDEESDPLTHCIAASESENLWVAARRVLNDDVFTAMWLRYAEDMSVNDISKTLDRSVSWTKVNLMRGRRSLESQLNDAAKQAYG